MIRDGHIQYGLYTATLGPLSHKWEGHLYLKGGGFLSINVHKGDTYLDKFIWVMKVQERYNPHSQEK